MPLYEYTCPSCKFDFELLRNSNEDAATASCLRCNGVATKKVGSVFGFSIAGGSPTEAIDKTIGRDSDRKWQQYSDSQSKRREGKDFVSVDSPKADDGKYMPVMSLGGPDERKMRKEYSEGLKSHQENLKNKGVLA